MTGGDLCGAAGRGFSGASAEAALREIDELALETRDGPYEHWPALTGLLRHGRLTGTCLPGYDLRYQYAVEGARFLLVVDMSCPWEEETLVFLLDEDLRRLSTVRFGLPRGSFFLRRARPIDARTLELEFVTHYAFHMSLVSEHEGGVLWPRSESQAMWCIGEDSRQRPRRSESCTAAEDM